MSTSIKYYDIFIIGGGLAGLNSAKKLVENSDLKIGLAERTRSIKNNPARLTFKDIVESYNIDDCIIGAYNSFGIINHHGSKSVHKYSDFEFVAIDYYKSCAKYLHDLKTYRNFDYYKDSVTKIVINNELAELQLISGISIKVKLIIDASGIAHVSANKLETQKPELYSHSFGQSFEGCNNQNVNEAYFIAGSVDYGSGGGWYYPKGKNNASAGFALINKTTRYPGVELKKKYYKAIKDIAPINKYLKNARPVQFEVGTIPIQPIKKFYNDRLLLVGDSAGQATSWMCTGVEPALKNSDMAANTALTAFKKNDFSAESLSQYQKLWDTENKKTFDYIENQKVKLWFLGEDVWDFIIRKDLNNLSAQEFYDRIRYNKHIMSKPEALFKWILYRLENFRNMKNYKQHYN